MNKLSTIFFIVITLSMLGVGIVLVEALGNSSGIGVTKLAKAEILQRSYDWGKIAYSGGNVSKTFIIKNTGADKLKLTNIKTSCACTQAQIAINGQKSPYFGMHTASSWVGEVGVGKEAQLTIFFDPAFHGPSGVGPVNRIISVETSDANNPKIEFTLTGTVVK